MPTICPRQWEYVRNSGNMSATVGECPRPDLTHVITLMLYQSIVTMTKRVVKQMYSSLLEYRHALNARKIQVCPQY